VSLINTADPQKLMVLRTRLNELDLRSNELESVRGLHCLESLEYLNLGMFDIFGRIRLQLIFDRGQQTPRVFCASF
jgi:hypothetical protein